MPRVAVSPETAPSRVAQVVKRLGHDIRVARKSRRLRQKELARMAGITVPTLRRVESGALGTGIGAYVAVLWAMGLDGHLDDVAAPSADLEGRTLEAARRGERVRPHTRLSDDF